MRMPALLALTCVAASAQSPDSNKLKVNGLGAFPMSDGMTSLWLNGDAGKPLVMVYFQGRDGWPKAPWNTNSEVEKTGWAWVELTSPKVRLRISLNTESQELEIQNSKSNLRTSNTFLVLHVDESPEKQVVIPLGVFDMPMSGDDPSSISLLSSHPALVEAIKKALL
jgi:hypothetical protein